MRVVCLLNCIYLSLLFNCFAEIQVSKMFSDNMILQRDAEVSVYGTGTEGEEVRVLINSNLVKTTVEKGHWSVEIPANPAGGPHKLQIVGTNKFEFNNVLFGDIWVCAGQSNMSGSVLHYSHSRYQATGGLKFKEYIETSSENSEVRLIGFNRVASEKVFLDVDISRPYDGAWQKPNSITLRDTSALGYAFGTKLHRKLKIPIGLIAANRGATPIQTWMSDSALKTLGSKAPPKTSLYRSVIAPLQKFTIKGVIWYQGENNSKSLNGSIVYAEQFKTLIKSWRSEWKQGDFPFLYFQLSGLRDSAKVKPDTNWPFLRESQTKALSLPNTGMAVIADLGHITDIHPHLKYDQAMRLVPLALEKVYKYDQIGSGPEYKKMEVRGNKVSLTFDRCGSGLIKKEIKTPWLKVSSSSLKGFVICGEDKKFYEAEGQIKDNTVIVSSSFVDKPVAVRYSWSGLPEANLFNKDGFPAVPFRTDNFQAGAERWHVQVPDKASQSNGMTNILCFGDSITRGTYVDGKYNQAVNWVSIIQGFAPKSLNFINFGRSGRRTDDKKSLKASVSLYKNVDHVIIFLGVNDLRVSTDEVLKKCVINVENMIKTYRQGYGENVKITVLSSPGLSIGNVSSRFANKGYDKKEQAQLDKLRVAYRQLAVREKVYFLDLWGTVSTGNYSDGLHPNKKGQSQIAEAVWRFIKEKRRNN